MHFGCVCVCANICYNPCVCLKCVLGATGPVMYIYMKNKRKNQTLSPLSLAAWPAARRIWVFTLKQTKELLLFAKQLIAVAMIHPVKYVNELPQAARLSFLHAAVVRLRIFTALFPV